MSGNGGVCKSEQRHGDVADYGRCGYAEYVSVDIHTANIGKNIEIFHYICDMIQFVNAKINLGLRVLRKRPDGYHDLSTVFYPIGVRSGTAADSGRLADVLEITCAEADSLRIDGNVPDCAPEQNLVWKALLLFRELYPACPPVQLCLDKHIPSQAGLGGGSADASFTLKLLNELCGCPLSEEQLLAAALRLGADCPFFILDRPCVAGGVGEKLTPIDLDLSGYWAAVVKPDAGIGTAQAFRGITPAFPEVSVEDVVSLAVEEWRGLLVNDFETSAFAIHPEFRKIKECLYVHGALYASMSGSGSSFFGIFRNREEAEQAAKASAQPFSTVTSL